MKMIIYTIALIFFATFAQGADQTASSCSQSDVQTAVNKCISTGGGTVNIPACSPNPILWSSPITVMATGGTEIRLIGSGETTTYIKGFRINIEYPYMTDIIEIAQMHLDGNNNSISSIFNTRYRPTTYGKELYIHDLTIDNYDHHGSGAIGFEGWYGVVTRITMDCSGGEHQQSGFPYGFLVHGDGNYNVDTSRLGTRNALFFEDSTFTNCGHTVVGMCDSHIVFRYNTVIGMEHAIDVHEPGYNYCRNATPASKMEAGDAGGAFELYNNNFEDHNLAYQSDTAFKPRGGWGIVANNSCDDSFSSQDYCFGLKLGDYSDIGADGSSGSCSTSETCNRCYTWDGNNPKKGCDGCTQSPESYYFQNNSCDHCKVAADVKEHYEDFGGNGCIREGTDYFKRLPTQKEDNFTWTPFTYPHPISAAVALPPSPPQNLRLLK